MIRGAGQEGTMQVEIFGAYGQNVERTCLVSSSRSCTIGQVFFWGMRVVHTEFQPLSVKTYMTRHWHDTTGHGQVLAFLPVNLTNLTIFDLANKGKGQAFDHHRPNCRLSFVQAWLGLA